MAAPPTTPLVAASDLKRQRGWTEGLIETLLGAPDALAPNPHGYRPPQRFFALDRIVEAECDAVFTTWEARLDDRRAWRRTQPTRTYLPATVDQLEWLADPRRIALFTVPRVPRPRRSRREPERPLTTDRVMYPQPRFEVLRLF